MSLDPPNLKQRVQISAQSLYHDQSLNYISTLNIPLLFFKHFSLKVNIWHYEISSGPHGIPLCHPQVQGTKRYLAPEILDESINAQHFDSWKCADVYRWLNIRCFGFYNKNSADRDHSCYIWWHLFLHWDWEVLMYFFDGWSTMLCVLLLNHCHIHQFSSPLQSRPGLLGVGAPHQVLGRWLRGGLRAAVLRGCGRRPRSRRDEEGGVRQGLQAHGARQVAGDGGKYVLIRFRFPD